MKKFFTSSKTDFVIAVFFLFVLTVLTCVSVDDKEGKPLPPPRSTSTIRLEDIRKQIEENPIDALNLIYIYREVYSVTEESETWPELAGYEKEAADNLCALQEKAVEEQRWTMPYPLEDLLQVLA